MSTREFKTAGRSVMCVLDESQNVDARVVVYPIGIDHFETIRQVAGNSARLWALFQDAIGTAGIQQPDGTLRDEKMVIADPHKFAEAIASELVPQAMGPLFKVLEECCRMPSGVELRDLPHWEIARVVTEWIDISFFPVQKKLAPWMGIFTRVLAETSAAAKSGRPETPSASPSPTE